MNPSSLVYVTGRPLRALAALALAGAALLSSGSAWAKDEFPGVVQETLGMACPPPCTICHTSPNGGGDTVGQPFVNNLLDLGGDLSVAGLPELLEVAKTAPCQDGTNQPCDVDGNGKSDIEDLEAGNDPNTGEPLACPRYGCGAHLAPERQTRHLDGTATLLLLGAIGMSARRVRRARR